ncbi:MAG: hypothetical protein SOY07_00860 [Bacteroidales bacterium]|nr:hypothetical protein [Bacteroidales bacterium]MDY4173848.1 hypothetical protein [Bacteroidales bacterium]
MKTAKLIAMALMMVVAMAACTNEVEKPDREQEDFFDEEYWATSTDTAVTGQATDVTYYSATLTGKLNIKTFSSLPQYTTWGVVISATNPDPMPNADDCVTIISKRQAKIFTCSATGLTMGTKYYYRAYLRESNGKTLRIGRVMYFTTLKCSVSTSDADPVSIFSATIRGESSIKLNDTKFLGEVGFLYTKRQTDRPNPSVDTFVKGSVSPNDSVRFEAQLTGLTSSTRYTYMAYLKIDTVYYWGDPISFTTQNLSIEDSDLPVDLGLTTLWAARNVGASKAELAGTYFGWGDPTGDKTSSNPADYPSVASLVGTDYDIATANLGAGWQMPTFEQFEELINECDWVWTTWHDTQGYAVVSRTNGKAIFLPAGGYAKPLDDDGREVIGQGIAEPLGYYWTANLSSFSRFAYSLKITSKKPDMHKLDNDKSYGYMVRAVLAE